jgi:hypothetical protein
MYRPAVGGRVGGHTPRSGIVFVMTGGPGQITILRSRYGGVYEPGEWVAFACWPDQIPPDWNADDVTCAEFFAARRGEIGGGATPQEAYEDLLRLLDQRRRGLQ